MISLLLDQGLPFLSAQLLRENGFDAEHVAALNLHDAADEEILQVALKRNSIVCTLDSDFHALMALRRMMRPSVIWIRVQGLRVIPAATLIQRVCAEASTALAAGSLVTCTAHGLRVRRLPV